jgi:hypothetical protein
MKDSDFEQLIASIREAGRIRRSEIPPFRESEVTAANDEAVLTVLDETESE